MRYASRYSGQHGSNRRLPLIDFVKLNLKFQFNNRLYLGTARLAAFAGGIIR
jgi:hypothetical protein